MNHNQQSSDGMHEDDAALSDFLASLMDYTPTIPDELVEHYLAKSGFQCPDVRLIRLVAVATQKFVAEVATDAIQQCKARQAAVVKDKRDKQQKDKRLMLTMEDLSRALHENLNHIGVNSGQIADNLPALVSTANLLKSTTIGKIRLYGADGAVTSDDN